LLGVPKLDSRELIQSRGGDFLDAHLEKVPPFRALIRSIECRIFERYCPLIPPVLDIGCGDGLFASLAFDRPLTVGIDPDSRDLQQALLEGSYVNLSSADSTALPFRSGQYKTVISNCVLEHIEDLDGALSEIVRVMDNGATLLFGVPSHRFGEFLLGSTIASRFGLKRLSQWYRNWFNRHSIHHHTDGPETWVKRLDQYNLTVRSWHYYMSPSSHFAFDLAHYLSVPNLISWKLTGAWRLPGNPLQKLFYRWLKAHYLANPEGEGAYLFFVCTLKRL